MGNVLATHTSLKVLTLAVAAIVLSACQSAQPPNDADLFETAVMSTVEALASLPPTTPTPSPSPSPTSTATPTHTPTPTSTPTPLPPQANVSVGTNCRIGPGPEFSRVASLQPDQTALVVAQSELEDYWYIEVPNQPNEFCWLSGEYATIDGDVSALPVLTPVPTPVPRMDFILYYHSSMKCGSTHVSFTVVNNSLTTFQSAKIHVEDLNRPDDIHGPVVDRHPFAPSPSTCPPGHSNVFPPGAAAYIVIPISPVTGGNDGLATIKLCTDDWGGGDCLSKSAYFRIPED